MLPRDNSWFCGLSHEQQLVGLSAIAWVDRSSLLDRGCLAFEHATHVDCDCDTMAWTYAEETFNAGQEERFRHHPDYDGSKFS